MLKSVAVVTGASSLQISKTVSLLQDDPAVFDQRQRRARDVIRRHQTEHQGISGNQVRRWHRRRDSHNCNSNTDCAYCEQTTAPTPDHRLRPDHHDQTFWPGAPCGRRSHRQGGADAVGCCSPLYRLRTSDCYRRNLRRLTALLLETAPEPQESGNGTDPKLGQVSRTVSRLHPTTDRARSSSNVSPSSAPQRSQALRR